MSDAGLDARPALGRHFSHACAVLAAGALLGVFVNALSPDALPLVWRARADTAGASALPAGVTAVSLEEFRAALASGRALAVDARYASLYAEGHVPGAVSLPHDALDAAWAAHRAKLESAETLVVYCASANCDNAGVVARALPARGCKDVRVFAGGWKLWRESGLPSEVSP